MGLHLSKLIDFVIDFLKPSSEKLYSFVCDRLISERSTSLTVVAHLASSAFLRVYNCRLSLLM